MKEIRIHGRGGQGSLVLAQFMAIAALEDEKYGQAFPFLGGGGERRGKPIMAFCRLSDRPIRIRSRITEPDYVIVQDATILDEVDVEEGLKPGGMILINTDTGSPRFGTENIAGIHDIGGSPGPADSGPADHQYRPAGDVCLFEQGAVAGSRFKGGAQQVSRRTGRKECAGRQGKLS